MTAYQCSDGSVVFQERAGRDSVRQLCLPCGQCVGCRLERSRQWAIRCLHEASLYQFNSFITLTYSDDFVSCSLVYRDFQLFMKRLRFVLRPCKVRFFMCGEYGDEFARPHFHACLFNCDFPDKVFHCETGSGMRVHRSPLLERLWPFGFSSIGDVTFESAAYVARYCMKKVTGDLAEEHYRVLDVGSGELQQRTPEFCHMSLKPGIGAGWLAKFQSDVYPDGQVVVNGVQCNPPKYYDRLYKKHNDEGFADLSMRRDQAARAAYSDNTDERLCVKEQVTKARIRSLKRSLP